MATQMTRYLMVVGMSIFSIDCYGQFFVTKRLCHLLNRRDILQHQSPKISTKTEQLTTKKKLVTTDIELFFPSARSNILKIFLDLINEEKKAIHFAAYTLTHLDVVEALKSAVKRGVSLHGVVDYNTIENFEQRQSCGDAVLKHQKEIERFLKEYNIAIYDRHKKCMHNKLFLFEQNGIDGIDKLLAGSANPSNAGLNSICNKEKNDEYSHNSETVVLLTNRPKEWKMCKEEIDYLIKKARED